MIADHSVSSYLDLRVLPIESSSSIYTIHGERFLAWLNRSLTRADPMPKTTISGS